MRIAVATDDVRTVSQHFGKARWYVVHTVEDGVCVHQELRAKLSPLHDHGHDCLDQHDRAGCGMGSEAAERHVHMVEPITDCDVVLVGGIGRAALFAIEQAQIRPIVTDIVQIENAVQACVQDVIENRPELPH